jgi:hypothetical protein
MPGTMGALHGYEHEEIHSPILQNLTKWIITFFVTSSNFKLNRIQDRQLRTATS